MITLKNKKGAELAISTIILTILGLIVLIAVVVFLTMNWGRLTSMLKGYVGTEMQNAIDLCKNQCNLGRDFDFCCTTKYINTTTSLNCTALKIDCPSADCTAVCG
jgi:hypothetical protein